MRGHGLGRGYFDVQFHSQLDDKLDALFYDSSHIYNDDLYYAYYYISLYVSLLNSNNVLFQFISNGPLGLVL